MSDTRRFGALLIAAAACVGASALAAEQKHNAINITGDLTLDAVQRDGTTSFTRAETQFNQSADVAQTSQSGFTHDRSDLVKTKLNLNFSFDLSANSKVFVQLGGAQYGGNNADNTNTGTGTNGGGDSSINVRAKQAYVELHEVFVQPLGLKFGVQDMVKGLDRGDGNHFVMFSPGWGKHFQIRDAGRVERSFSTRARGQNVPVNSARGFDDLNWDGGGTFAWVATWDQKDMFSASAFYVALEEDGQGINEARLAGIDASVPLKMVNEKSLFTLHGFNVKDNTQVQSELTIATKPGNGFDFWQYGLGMDLFFQDTFEFYTEAAWQSGQFASNYNTVAGALNVSNIDQGSEKRQNAYAWYAGGKFMVPGMADWKPALDVSFWSFSGDDDQHDEKNTGFINYGDNKSTLVVEDNEYGIGLSNNYDVWRFKGSVDLDGIFKKGRKTPLAISYHDFRVNAPNLAANYVSGPFPVAMGGLHNSRLGAEVDVTLAHEYSENVTFKLGFGTFAPGGYIRENANLSPQENSQPNGGNGTAGTVYGLGSAGDGANAYVTVFTTQVKF